MKRQRGRRYVTCVYTLESSSVNSAVYLSPLLNLRDGAHSFTEKQRWNDEKKKEWKREEKHDRDKTGGKRWKG